MAQSTQFDILRIGIASGEAIRSWSHGEVKKPETINYRTFKPERDGLFCERVFGPVKDYECHCGKYKKIKFKGIICDRCGVEVTTSKVRRSRMGHIELAAPAVHIWYLKGVPSPVSQILDISTRNLEKVIYFASYIVTHIDHEKLKENEELIKSAIEKEKGELRLRTNEVVQELKDELESGLQATPETITIDADEGDDEDDEDEDGDDGDELVAEADDDGDLEDEDEEEDEDDGETIDAAEVAKRVRRVDDLIEQEQQNLDDQIAELQAGWELAKQVEKKQLLNDNQYRTIRRFSTMLVRQLGGERGAEEWGSVVRAGLGAEAIRDLLEQVDLDSLAEELRDEMESTSGPRQLRAIKRLGVVEAFRKSKNQPQWMVLDTIPVIPPDLRPMVQLDGGRFAASDLNDLYRRIINRNNRLRRIIEINAPESIINHEKRLLQEAVDALIDNSRRPRPVTGSNKRPLKSLSDMLRGKEGRFRKNLLGKRVDYSGRSVIVVGPELQLNQCGLPKEMALELFKPFVMKRLVELEHTNNIKTAKRMVDRLDPRVWDALDDIIRQHPVLLNRAPTLHRLGIQAFEPILVDGKAIQIHPLVCHAFNADFDGDQMAVHVPLSAAAQAEARLLMLATQNLFSPASGNPLVAPTYDMILGCYYLTQDEIMDDGNLVTLDEHTERRQFLGIREAVMAYDLGELDIHRAIRCRIHALTITATRDGQPHTLDDKVRQTFGYLGGEIGDVPYGDVMLRHKLTISISPELIAAYAAFDEQMQLRESSLLEAEMERPDQPGCAQVHRLEAAAEAIGLYREAVLARRAELAAAADEDAHDEELTTRGEYQSALDADQEAVIQGLLGSTWGKVARFGSPHELQTLRNAMIDLAELLRDTERKVLRSIEEGLALPGTQVVLALDPVAVNTTVGRLMFNEILPIDLRIWDADAKGSTNRLVPRNQLSELISASYEAHGQDRCVRLLEDIKRLGFDYATRAGVTISVTDLPVPSSRATRGQLYFTGQHVREYRAGATTDEATRNGKIVRVAVKEVLGLPMAVAQGNLVAKDASDRRRQRYGLGDIVVGDDVANEDWEAQLEALELQVGDVLSSRVTRGIARWLDGQRRLDARKARQLEKELSEKLQVGGRNELLAWTQAEVDQINADFDSGMISSGERTQAVTGLWMDASDRVYELLLDEIRKDNPVYMMSDSGARGGKRQTTQLSGMRGLMSDPSGRLIEDLPIKSNFREGLTLHEYFISTHGARKGLADTALRTADAGYLTRKMVDVGQDVIIREIDCGTTNGITTSTTWEQQRRCPTSGVLVRHLGNHCRVATSMLERLAEHLKLGDDSIERQMDGEIPYVAAIKPKNNKDIEKYERLNAGDKLGEWEIDRDYRFDVLEGWLRIRTLSPEKQTAVELPERIAGRISIEPLYHPVTGELLVEADEEITDDMANRLAFDLLFEEVSIRSPATCDSRRGICAKCYGRDLSSKGRVVVGEAVGIIAAQSIGEPGTQLTMRTFHTGGVVAGPQLTGVVNVKRRKMEAMKQLMDDMAAGRFTEDELGSGERERNRAIQEMLKVLEDACGGLLRVVELFEARRPKGEAITTDVDGIVADVTSKGLRKVVIHSVQPVTADPSVFKGATAAEVVMDGRRTLVKEGQNLTRKTLSNLLEAGNNAVAIRKEYLVPYRGELEVQRGDEVRAGDRLTPGPLHPAMVLDFKGVKGVIAYIVEEIQKVYRSQGVSINDKHIEIVVRQMLRKREIVDGGDTDLLPGNRVDRAVFEEENERIVTQGGMPAVSRFALLGITEASLATESFLSAASFQKTTRVLTEAAVQGKEDRLLGLKENVIIGRLIPAGTGMALYQDTSFDFGDVDREALLGGLTAEREVDEEEEQDLLAEMRDVERFGEGLGVSLEEPDEPDFDEDEDDEDEDEDESFFGDDDDPTADMSEVFNATDSDDDLPVDDDAN